MIHLVRGRPLGGSLRAAADAASDGDAIPDSRVCPALAIDTAGLEARLRELEETLAGIQRAQRALDATTRDASKRLITCDAIADGGVLEGFDAVPTYSALVDKVRSLQDLSLLENGPLIHSLEERLQGHEVAIGFLQRAVVQLRDTMARYNRVRRKHILAEMRAGRR